MYQPHKNNKGAPSVKIFLQDTYDETEIYTIYQSNFTSIKEKDYQYFGSCQKTTLTYDKLGLDSSREGHKFCFVVKVTQTLADRQWLVDWAAVTFNIPPIEVKIIQDPSISDPDFKNKLTVKNNSIVLSSSDGTRLIVCENGIYMLNKDNHGIVVNASGYTILK